MRRALIVCLLLVAMPAWGAEPRAGPDRNLTPGATLPCTLADLCRPGYTKRVRNVTAATEREIWRRYGYEGRPAGDWELDHFVPLELCGSNDPTNLWPQPAEPRPGYHEKDVVEHILHALVCHRPVPLLSLAAAQERIQSWLAIWTILHPAEALERPPHMRQGP